MEVDTQYVRATQGTSSGVCEKERYWLGFTRLTEACNVTATTHIMTHPSYVLITRFKALNKQEQRQRKIKG